MKYKIMVFLVILSTLIAGCHVVPAGYSISKKAASPKILPGFGGITGVVTQGDDRSTGWKRNRSISPPFTGAITQPLIFTMQPTVRRRLRMRMVNSASHRSRAVNM